MQNVTRVATTVRMPDSVHYLAKIEAAKQRLTLSDYIALVLAKAVEKASKVDR